MIPYVLFMILIQVGSAAYLLVLLHRYRQRRDHFGQSHPALDVYPGISILVPIKGPVPHLAASLGAMVEQDYPGPLELILAFQDAGDPCIAEAKRVLSQASGKLAIKWLTGLPFRGHNPKNSNLAHAFEEASHDWVFTLDADTICSISHLRCSMDLLQGNPGNFVTSVTIHEEGENLWAMFEGIGTNLEMSLYFLSHYLGGQKPLPINGAAVLFSKELLHQAGGYALLVNELAEDATMMKTFSSLGAQGYLSRDFVRVIQRRQDFPGLYRRYVRWLMVVRCYMPKLFILAPFFWWAYWNFIAGLFLGSSQLLYLGLSLFFLRLFLTLRVQSLVDVPRSDVWKAVSIVVYDIVMPIFWVSAIFKRSLIWAGVPLRVLSTGQLKKVDDA